MLVRVQKCFFFPFFFFLAGQLCKYNLLTLFSCSLEKQAERRATPWRMLEHPWMVEMKGKRVNMVQFLRTVWDWQD